MSLPGCPVAPAHLDALLDTFRGQVLDTEEKRWAGADDLRRARDGVAAHVRERARPGEIVVLALPNGPLFFSALCGVLEAGAVAVLMHGESPASELMRLARRHQARHLITDPGASPDRSVAAVDGETSRLDSPGVGACHWTELDLADCRVRADLAGTVLHPTSGTTGEPKLAVRGSACAVSEASHYIETVGITDADTILCTTPLSHAYAYGMCFMVPLIASTRVITMRRFAPRVALRAVREEGVTVLAGVPATLEALVAASGGAAAAPRHVFTAGAPLSPAAARRFFDATGVALRPLYGTTETGGISIVPAGADPCAAGVGPPMAGVEVRLRPAGAGSGASELGVLQVRSASMMAGYLADDGVDASLLRDGWFETGDLAHVGDDGAIHLHGRERDFINVFGMKVVPEEVEQVIAGDPRVAEVKVYAGRHGSGSDAVFAAVVAHGGFCDAEALRRHCQAQLVAYKCPAKVFFVDALPRTASGKVIQRQLPGAV